MKLLLLAAVPFTFGPEITVNYLGVSLNVLVACVIGTYSSFSVGEQVTPRSRMWQVASASVLMGAAFTAIVNAAIVHWVGLEMTGGLQAGLGAAVSFCTRFILPWLADVVRTGKWLSWVPFGRKGE